MESWDSRVIHKAGVRHLLEIDSNRSFHLGLTPCDPLLNHVLQIGKASPDVPEIFHGVCPGTRIPVPKKTQQEGGTKIVNRDRQNQGDLEYVLLKSFS